MMHRKNRAWRMMAVAALAGACVAVAAFNRKEARAAFAAEADHVRTGSEKAIPMVEFLLGDRHVIGRLLGETDQALRVETAAGGAIGYPKEKITGLKRYSIPTSAYYEKAGDRYRESAWESENATPLFIKARRAYQKALEAAHTDEARAHVNVKLQDLAQDQQEWRQDALRRKEMKKAEYEMDLARLQKQLAEEKLTTIRRQEQALRHIQSVVNSLERDMRRVLLDVENLQRHCEEIDDDVDDLQRLRRASVSRYELTDLKNSQRRLEARVRRLEDAVSAGEG